MANSLRLTPNGYDYVLGTVNGKPMKDKPVDMVFGSRLWADPDAVYETISEPLLEQAMDQHRSVLLVNPPATLSEVGIRMESGKYLSIDPLPLMRFTASSVVRFTLLQHSDLVDDSIARPIATKVASVSGEEVGNTFDKSIPDGAKQAPAAPISVAKPLPEPEPEIGNEGEMLAPTEPYIELSVPVMPVITRTLNNVVIGVGLPINKMQHVLAPAFYLHIQHYVRL